MKPGKFITIEGIEGAGKSTAINDIRAYLEAKGIEAVFTREPGGTPLAEEIRKVLLLPRGDESVQPETELLLMFACRAQLVNNLIKPALHAGKWVVSDRYVDASYAYQGYGRGINLNHIQQLDTMTVDDVYPDLTLFLDVPVELGLQRAEKRGQGKDRIEQEKVDFFTRVRDGYLARADHAPERIKVIDASKTPAEAAKEISKVLDGVLSGMK
jgi:dTMP kinase